MQDQTKRMIAEANRILGNTGTSENSSEGTVYGSYGGRAQRDSRLSTSLNTIATVQTGWRSILSSVSCFADLTKPEIRAFGVYGYAFSTPFAILSHMTDPNLTSGEQYGLSAMEVGFAIGGVALAVGTAGTLPLAELTIGAIYTLGTYAVSDYITKKCENENR